MGGDSPVLAWAGDERGGAYSGMGEELEDGDCQSRILCSANCLSEREET